jgi:hypothetical protein
MIDTGPFSSMIEACFGRLGADATYTPQGGSGATVKIIFTQPTEVAGLFDAGLAAPAHVADVRVAEVATPAAGDQLTVGSDTYLIRQAHQDSERLVWRLDLDKQ